MEVTKMIKTEDGLEEWEPTYKNVLDNGFIGLVDFMGDDSSIVNSARVSYGKGTKATRSDEGLIRYLIRNHHWTPVEMCDFTFHVKAPIFVFRQWQRHRMGSFNEMSARYSLLDNEMYFPHYDNTSPQAQNNKQGRESNLLVPEDYNAIRTALDHLYEESYQTYQYLNGPNENGDIPNPPHQILERKNTIEAAALASIEKLRKDQLSMPEEERIVIDEDYVESVIRDWFTQSETWVVSKDYPGIARELARMVLPVATYSQMYWKVNLRSLMNFITLRSDPHAQYEIRVYSDAILEMIRPFVPMSIRAFEDYILHGNRLSSMESSLLRDARNGNIDITNDEEVKEYLTNLGCSSREVREFIERF